MVALLRESLDRRILAANLCLVAVPVAVAVMVRHFAVHFADRIVEDLFDLRVTLFVRSSCKGIQPLQTTLHSRDQVRSKRLVEHLTISGFHVDR